MSTAQRRQHLLAHLSYNIGRLVTYTTLGALAGLTGQTLGFAGRLAGLENFAALLGGALMLITGLLLLDLLPHRSLQKFDPLQLLRRTLKPVGTRIASTAAKDKFTLGLLLGLLPCGLIYAALFKAMATGTAWAGGLTMLAFGLGTTSALLVIGLGSSAFGATLKSLNSGVWGIRMTALTVTLLGSLLLWRGVTSQASAGTRQGTTPAAAAAHCH